MNEAWSVFGKLVLDDKDYNKDLKDSEKRTEKISKKMSKSFEGIGKAIKGMSGVMAGATAALGGLVLSASDSAAEINKFSQITGTTTDEFQRWDSVLKANGFSMEQAAGDLAALGEKAMDAANGVGEGAELFELLGVTVTDASGKLKSQGQIFDETISSLQGMEDITQRNAIASALLSTTGEELVPVLNMTNEELQRMKSNANVIDQDQLDKAAEFKAGYDGIKQSLSTVVTELGIQFMPLLASLFSWVEKNMPTIKATMETVFNATANVLNFVGDVFTTYVIPALKTMFDFVQSNWPTIQSIGENVFGALFDVAQTLWEVFNQSLLPVLRDLWNFIEPTFPLIGDVIGIAFEVVIESAKAVIEVFGAVFDAISTAINAIDEFFKKDEKASKTRTFGNVQFEETGEGFLGGSFSRAPRANGGRVVAGRSYNVGERGVETFVPDENGVIIPNQGMSKQEVVNNNNEITINVESVRNDDDISAIEEAVNRALFNMQRTQARGVGV